MYQLTPVPEMAPFQHEAAGWSQIALARKHRSAGQETTDVRREHRCPVSLPDLLASTANLHPEQQRRPPSLPRDDPSRAPAEGHCLEMTPAQGLDFLFLLCIELLGTSPIWTASRNLTQVGNCVYGSEAGSPH